MASFPSTALAERNTPALIQRAGGLFARYGLVIVIAWIGAMKFTAYEAQAIQPLIAHSPAMSWLYNIFSVRTFSALLGVLELSVAAQLAVKPWAPRVSVLGSVIAVGLFVATLSFLITTPGVWAADAGDFPILSDLGGFLIKDVALLGLAVWTLADALGGVADASHR